MVEKSPNAFRTISEVSDALNVPAHVLRFWESKFAQIKPVKRGGGRRYYRPTDLDLIRGIRDLLYSDGLTIKGVQKVLRERGVRHVIELGSLDDAQPAPPCTTKASPKPVKEHDPEPLFELAENQAPAPHKQKLRPKTPAVHGSEKIHALKARKKPAPEPDILSLFDDPLPPKAAPQAIVDDEVITQVAKIAEGERHQNETPAPMDHAHKAAEPEHQNPDKRIEIQRVLGKLEHLRDRMKSR